MNHQDNSVFFILIQIIICSGYPKNSRVDELIFLPFRMLFILVLLLQILTWLGFHHPLFNFCFHIFCALSFIEFLLLIFFVIG